MPSEMTVKKDRERAAKYYRDNREKVIARILRWRAANPDKVRSYNLERKYGISLEAFKTIFRLQGKRCAVCRCKDPRSKKGWVVDHCHRNNYVRGILCAFCNMALGFMGDTLKSVTKRTEQMKTYLKKGRIYVQR